MELHDRVAPLFVDLRSEARKAFEGIVVVEALGQLVDRALVVTKGADRKDLTDRLTNTQRRLADPSVRVLVVGEFKQGKSLLVNALLGTDVCPIDEPLGEMSIAAAVCLGGCNVSPRTGVDLPANGSIHCYIFKNTCPDLRWPLTNDFVQSFRGNLEALLG